MIQRVKVIVAFSQQKIFIEPLVNANNAKGKIGSEDENQPTGDAII